MSGRRPMRNGLMLKCIKDDLGFCKVCEKAIAERIDCYSGPGEGKGP